MSSPLISVEPERLGVRRSARDDPPQSPPPGVVEAGRLVGVVSSHDMLGLQGAIRSVWRARSRMPGRSISWHRSSPRLTRWSAGLCRRGAGARHRPHRSRVNDRLVRRAISLVEAALVAEGADAPVAAYSWLAGSERGRREQTLKTDQDTAWPTTIRRARHPRFRGGSLLLAGRATAAVGTVKPRAGGAVRDLGFSLLPPCPAGYMASNPLVSVRVGLAFDALAWMDTPAPERLLFASVFDLRPVAIRN